MMKQAILRLLFLTLPFLSHPALFAAPNVWAPVGPRGGGTVYAIVTDPQDANQILVGTSAGIFKTLDGGNSWTTANGGLTTSTYGAEGPSVMSLAWGPNGTLYGGQQNGKFIKSTDRGASWSAVSQIVGNRSIHFIINRPDGSLFVGTTNGLFKSTDGGVVWTAITIDQVTDFFVKGLVQDGLGTLYVAISNKRIFKCVIENGSDVWSSYNDGLPVDLRAEGLTLGLQNEVLVGASSGKVFRRAASAEQWSSVSIPNLTSTVTSLAMSRGGDIFAGTSGKGLYQWRAADSSWVSREADLLAKSIYTLASHSGGALLYAGTSKEGFFKSTDQGATWVPLNKGLAMRDIRAMFLGPDRTVYAGSFDAAVFRSTNQGLSWSNDNPSQSVLYSPANALAVTPRGTLFASAGNGLYKRDSGDVDWVRASESFPNSVNPVNPDGQFSHLVADTAGDLYVTFASSYLYKSGSNENGNLTWTEITPPGELAIGTISGLTLSPDRRLYAASNKGVFTRSSGGEWTSLNNAGLNFTNNSPSQLVIAPDGTLFIGTSAEGVFKRSPGEEGWSSYSAELTDLRVKSLLLDTHNVLFAGTVQGVYYRILGHPVWKPLKTGLTSGKIQSLVHDASGTSQILYAGTPHGVYKMEPSFCLNGFTEPEEECDDGNTIDTDTCRSDCKRAVCGDGILQAGMEDCDMGPQNSDTGPGLCRTNCKNTFETISKESEKRPTSQSEDKIETPIKIDTAVDVERRAEENTNPQATEEAGSEDKMDTPHMIDTATEEDRRENAIPQATEETKSESHAPIEVKKKVSKSSGGGGCGLIP